MLSRTARFAAALIIGQAGIALATPNSAVAATRFQCGDSGVHTCCVPAPECSSGVFCCIFGLPDSPAASLESELPCGCG